MNGRVNCMPQDFTKKRPVRPQLSPETESREMDHYLKELSLDGFSLLPGESTPEPMVGVDPEELKRKYQENADRKERVLRDLAATWQCLECRKEFPGKVIRVRVRDAKWEIVNGKSTLIGGREELACPKCDGPVVKTKDPYRSRLI